MKDAISPISVMHIYAYAMMVVPIIVLNRNRIYEKKIYVIIKIILYILILLSIFIPIFIEGFGYASPGLFAVWVISTICIMVVYWIAFFFGTKKFLECLCAGCHMFCFFLCIWNINRGKPAASLLLGSCDFINISFCIICYSINNLQDKALRKILN